MTSSARAIPIADVEDSLINRTPRQSVGVDMGQAVMALQSMGNAVIITDVARIVTYLNPEAERLTGWCATEAVGHGLDQVLHLVSARKKERIECSERADFQERHPEDLAEGVLLHRRDRSSVAVSHSVAPLRDGEGSVLGMVVLLQDVTRRQRMGRRLYYEATHDPLTGLINRREFERRLGKMLRTRATAPARHAMIYFDLDRFKLVNDNFGHEAGDDLLRKISGLLRSLVRRYDVVARLGGDEFAALLENCPPRKANWIAERFRAALADIHFIAGGTTFSLGASVGLLHLPERRGRIADVMQAVDAASYRAKVRGGNCVEVIVAPLPETDRRKPLRSLTLS